MSPTKSIPKKRKVFFIGSLAAQGRKGFFELFRWHFSQLKIFNFKRIEKKFQKFATFFEKVLKNEGPCGILNSARHKKTSKMFRKL